MTASNEPIAAEVSGAEPAGWSPARDESRLGLAWLAGIWQRIALIGILLLATFLNFYDLAREGYANTYYATGVFSMLQSWHNFFFVSFDPGGFVTIDKPPLGFWLQAASAKLFGFHGWSLILPEALAGIIAVALIYQIVRKVFGEVAGLIAALALAVTPVVTAASRDNIVDSLLMLAILLGAWAVLRAVERGQLRWLLLAVVFVGLGFNIKMLEAFLVVPAFFLVYFVGSHIRWRDHVWHLALAGVVLMVVSLSWATAVDMTPPSQRPFVGSSADNSEYNLIFGYNGLQRLLGRRGSFGSLADLLHLNAGANLVGLGNGDDTQTQAAQPPQGNRGGFGGPGSTGENGPAGPLRLLDTQLGGQASWLIPLALLGILAVAWRRRPRFPLDAADRHIVLWGSWLLTGVAFFSVAGFFHKYYLVTIAPPIAALAGIGLVAMWRAYRGGGWRGWLLPAALLAVAGVQDYLLQPYPSYSRWLTPLIVGGAVLAALVLATARLMPRMRVSPQRLALVAATVGALALFLAPGAWAAETAMQGGGGMTPSAGPAAGRDGGVGNFFGGGRGQASFARGGPGGDRGEQADSALIQYLEANQGSAKFLVAVSNSMAATPIILASGKPVMALGGFSGQDQILTTDQLATLVKNGTVRYFMVGGGFGGFGGFAPGGALPGNGQAAPSGAAEDQNARQPGEDQGQFDGRGNRGAEANGAGAYTRGDFPQPGSGFGQESGQQRQAANPPAGGVPGFVGRGGEGALSAWVAANCSLVPSSAISGGNVSGLYDCGAAASGTGQ